MTDYGHPLRFGAFLTPSSSAPERVLALARLAEQAGLDLVSFQDHPYQPAHLDTWTLLSVVAAQTSRVTLAPNVANLPLRPPAVLARSAATLDLLSGGRIELGLGAGAFWEAIEAMGGARLGPADAVRGLEEAVEVVRQVWDVGARGGVRVEGRVHRVVGAKRGPAPAHDIGIWLGAYKPRMLALTGRTADGWLPSLSYLAPGDLERGSRLVDEAATGAGRDPAAVLRLLNIGGTFSSRGTGMLQGPAEQWAEELAGLALEHGTSVFLLGSDDADDLRRFAAEVAPAARELVDAERRPGPVAVGRTGVGEVGSPVEVRAADARPGAFPVAATPDDGARRTPYRAFEESGRPAGPPADPGRSYTAHEVATAQHLVEVHDGLRAELAQVDALVERVTSGAVDVASARSHIQTMTIRQNKWTVGTYCESYCRIVTTHHTIEDASMFPHLRRGDPRLGAVLDRLEEEHHAIHGLLEGVDRALVQFVGSPDGGARLREAVDRLADGLLSHLAYEERELLEPLARLGMR